LKEKEDHEKRSLILSQMLLDAGVFGVQLGLQAPALKLWLQIFKETHEKFICKAFMSDMDAIEDFDGRVYANRSIADATCCC
jgi:hypothetical protein